MQSPIWKVLYKRCSLSCGFSQWQQLQDCAIACSVSWLASPLQWEFPFVLCPVLCCLKRLCLEESNGAIAGDQMYWTADQMIAEGSGRG